MNSIEITQLSVVVTYQCNLHCQYCFVSDKSMAKTIETRTVLQAVEMWKRFFSGGKKQLKILFTGGEPLLKKDLILSLIDELAQTYPEIDFAFHITTNGLLLSDDFLQEVVRRNNLFLCVSIDGDELSNKERFSDSRATFEVVQDNIVSYAKQLDNTKFRVRMTITPRNVRFFYDNIGKLVELGVQNIHFSPNYEEKWADDCVESFFHAYSKLDEYVNKGIIMEPFTSFRYNVIEKQGPYEHDCSFLPTINADGDVYYCPRYAGKRLSKLGHVSKPFEVLLNFRKVVEYGQNIFQQEQFSFVCPSNYMENSEVSATFRKFYDRFKVFC